MNIPALDGTNHNSPNPNANAAGTSPQRFAPSEYTDGVRAMAGADRPGARDISNHVFARTERRLNTRGTNNNLWAIGQFYDHDFSITIEQKPDERIDIPVPIGDPQFDRTSTGTQVIPLRRSKYDPATGVGNVQRAHINEQTGWIDASQVYGYGQETPTPLRTFSGGRMKTSEGDLLPRISDTPPPPPFPRSIFVCGDFHPRCNETPTLTAYHTLFVREHNRKVAEYAARNPDLTDEQLFQLGRRWVTSVLQNIYAKEFIPHLTGRTLKPYAGHNPSVDGRLATEFTGAIYRMGHTLLTQNLKIVDSEGNRSFLDLGDTLFQAPDIFKTGADVDGLFRGLKRQRHETVDCLVIDGVRNFLVVDEGLEEEFEGFFDLPAINIQRGRDLGLPTFNNLRRAFGLPPAKSFFDKQVFEDDAASRLASVYADTDDIDLFAGAICEKPATRKGDTGQLMTEVILRQSEQLRDADRFWFENPGVLPADELEAVKRRSLADVIVDNTGLARKEVGFDAFTQSN